MCRGRAKGAATIFGIEADDFKVFFNVMSADLPPSHPIDADLPPSCPIDAGKFKFTFRIASAPMQVNDNAGRKVGACSLLSVVTCAGRRWPGTVW